MARHGTVLHGMAWHGTARHGLGEAAMLRRCTERNSETDELKVIVIAEATARACERDRGDDAG